MSIVPDVPVLFGGEWRSGAGDAWIPVLDPSDLRQVVARVPALSAADVARAYESAEFGAKAWHRTDAISRGSVLIGAARNIRERLETIAMDLVREMGKTLAEARIEVTKTADFLEYYGGMARWPGGYELYDARPGVSVSVRREPLGVVLAITPWNDPLLTPARKIAPALAAGNAVILKPATDTPLVAVHFVQALVDAGLPLDVLSVVTGRGREISDALLQDPRLAAVTFTGSNEVGTAIHTSLANRNIRLQTEMGGKNATVVLADADLDLASATVAAAAFAQAGQRCTATSRLVVDKTVAGELVERIRERVSAMVLGPGLQPSTTLGPVVNAAQRDFVLGHVRHAGDEGAAVVLGGGTPSDPALAHGCFVEPTILTGVTRQMAISRDEVFGPVLAVLDVQGLKEAIEVVNDSRFGLSAAIFTRELKAANIFLAEADTGQVAVNLPTSGWDVHQPFGGFRESGSAFKEQGLEALQFYTRVKTCAVRYSW